MRLINLFLALFFVSFIFVAHSEAFEVSGEIIYEEGGFGIYVVALYETVGLPEHITFVL